MSAIDPEIVLDLRTEQSNPPRTKKTKHKIVGGKVFERDPATVRGIVLHQTAVRFGAGVDAVRAAEGDEKLARWRRALGVACHALAFTDRKAVIACPLPWLVWHGNGLNNASLGLEVEGHYAGVETASSSASFDQLTDDTIVAARTALWWLMTEGRRIGMPIEYVWAHRQSSGTRRSDPGQAIWHAVVVEYARPVLGLRTEVGKRWRSKRSGSGRTIPHMWDPTATSAY